MNSLVLHPNTKHTVDHYLKVPSHALLLVGPTGIGKACVADDMIAKILNLTSGLKNYPYIMFISPDGNSIGIENIRRLEAFLSLRVPRDASINRAVIIENSHALTLEAQNALLKTLEEPPDGTVIVLTANHAQALLPTVRSRAQTIDIRKPSRRDLEAHFRALNYDCKQIAQSYAISGGLPGLMTALLEQSDHPLLQATAKARSILQASPYERLLIMDDLTKERSLAFDTAFILQQMAHISLQTAGGRAAKRWQAILEASFAAAEALKGSAQPKLALTVLALAF